MLWSNPNPTAKMNDGDIAFDTGNFPFYILEVRYSVYGNTDLDKSEKHLILFKGLYDAGNYGSKTVLFKITDNGLTRETTTENNEYDGIPIKVYGFKC